MRIGVRNVPASLDVAAIALPQDTVTELGPSPVPERTVNIVVSGGPHQVRGPALVIQIGGIPPQPIQQRIVEPVRVPGPAYYAPSLAAELMGMREPDLVFEVNEPHHVLPIELRLRHDVTLIATSGPGQLAIAAARRPAGGWAYWITDGLAEPTVWVRRLIMHHRWLMRGRMGWWSDIPEATR